MSSIVPVILCGGSGSRLWPLSRALYPKQLLPLAGSGTMLQETAGRLARLSGSVARPLVVCSESQRFLVKSQLEAVGVDARLLLEPVGRNTAPAVAVAALRLQQQDAADDLLLVLPSDHVIARPEAFAAAVEAAVRGARAGQLVTFGVVPMTPETGYGYIRAPGGEGLRAVAQFVEKPAFETARRFVQSGEYFWNSGMFLFRADRFLEALDKHAPDIRQQASAALAAATETQNGLCLDPALFGACRAESIDYAVMEKTDEAALVPLDAGWSDVGSWAALHDASPQDEAGNTLLGDVVARDCTGSYLRAESRLLTAVGLDGCIVIETKDAVLVVPRERAQDVKGLVAELEARDRAEARLGREVFRPWGSYDSVDAGPGFQVKRLTVLPGAVLSLQMHHRRAEHWIVVSGVAHITRGDEVYELRPNEHTLIPLGARHRIENRGTEIVRIIEVQLGDYLGEDDIVRFEDRYGREGRTD